MKGEVTLKKKKKRREKYYTYKYIDLENNKFVF